MTRPRDIEARVRFLLPSQGGRKGPVPSDYRPQFRYQGEDWVVALDYPDEAWLNLGLEASVYFAFLNPGEHVGRLVVGTPFELREGARVVAEGVVTRIVDLEQSARRLGTSDQ